MYVPILKTRNSEMKVLKELNYCFSDNIIPMIEIIDKKYDLNAISKLLNGNKAFIDLFRFSINKYGSGIDINKADYSWIISEKNDVYISELNKIDNSTAFIPVVSIKKDFEMGNTDLNKLIIDLQGKYESIALRFTDEFIDQCNNIFPQLRSSDFLMMDIEEQNPESKFIEIGDFSDLKIVCKRIIINSPRLKNRKNGDYTNGITDSIDTSLIDIVNEQSIDGFGDYMGLKDCMPESHQGSNGIGNALALIYDYRINKFYCFINEDKTKGMTGYREVREKILNEEQSLNPEGDCPAFNKIKEIECGNWSTWHEITAKRYLHQIYKKKSAKLGC